MPDGEPAEKEEIGEYLESGNDTADTDITSDSEERLKQSRERLSENGGNILNIDCYCDSYPSLAKLSDLSKEDIQSALNSPAPSSSVKSSTPHLERIMQRKRASDEYLAGVEVKRKKIPVQIDRGPHEVTSTQQEKEPGESQLKEELAALREKYEELEGKYRKALQAQSARKKVVSPEELGKNVKVVKSTFSGILTYYIDEETKEVVLLTLLKPEVNRSSISSGYLADRTSSESTSSTSSDPLFVPSWSGPLTSLPSSRLSSSSTISSSPVSSSASCQIQRKGKHHDFAVPIPPMRLSKGFGCVCTCFCSQFLGSELFGDLICSIKSSESSGELPFVSGDPECAELAITEPLLTRSPVKGLLVFSKWPADSWYYPGIVENETETSWKTSTHLNVRFYENNILRKISTTHMFPAHLVTPGIEVMCKESLVYVPYSILGTSRLSGEEPSIIFKVQDGNEEKSFPFDKVAVPDISFKALKRERGEELTPSLSTKKGHIDPEVLRSGKRKRTPKRLSFPDTPQNPRHTPSGHILPISEAVNEKLGVPLDLPSSGKGDKCQTASSTPRSESPRPGPSGVREDISESGSVSSSSDMEPSFIPLRLDVSNELLDVECISPSKTLLKTIAGFRVKSIKKPQEDAELERQLGPIPTDPLFTGYVFVITHTRTSRAFPGPEAGRQSPESEWTSSDCEEHFELLYPFDFLRLKAQILSGGGEVFNFITDVPQGKITKTIVVTDLPCVTANYLLSIAKGIPIYRHDLIINCCNKKRNIDQEINYAIRMPNGRSLETSRLVMENKCDSLKDLCCLLCLSNSRMVPIWKKLISYAGGKAFTTHSSIPGGILSIGVIIADETSVSPYFKLASKSKIPILSTTWLVQTVIHGRPRPPEARPDYIISTDHI